MAFTEDLTVFFDTDDFGIAGTVSGSSVNGIFRHEYMEIMDVAGERPTFTCRTADVSAVAVGAAATINSTSYRVRIIQPDGTGVTRLILEESS